MDNHQTCACKGHQVTGYTALHRAIAKKQPKALKKALKKIKDTPDFINATDSQGKTPLAFAITQNASATVIGDLLAANPDIEIKDCNGWTILQMAALHNDTQLMSLLLQHPSAHTLINVANAQGDTPLSIAVKNNRFNLITLLVANGANLEIALKYPKEWNLLHMAAFHNNLKMLTLLLQHEKALSLINRPDAHGDTPLATAVKYNQFAVIQCLLEKGADPSPIIGSTNQEKKEKLPSFLKTLSLAGQNFELFDYLIQHLGETAGLSKTTTTLHVASGLQNKSFVEAAVKKEKSHLNPENDWKALYHLVTSIKRQKKPNKAAFSDIVRCLLRTEPTLNQVAEMQEKNGVSLLQIAIAYHIEELIPLLLRCHSNPNKLDSEGYSPIEQAVMNGCSVSTVKNLIQYRAVFNWKVLYYLVGTNECETVSDQQRFIAMIHCLLAANPRLNQEAEAQGLSLLQVAIFHNLEMLVPFLLHHHSKLGNVNLNGFNELAQAILQSSSASIVKNLIQYNADPYFRTTKGESMLYLATMSDKKSVLERLEHDTKMSMDIDTTLEEPFPSAAKPLFGKERIKIMKLLLKHGLDANIANEDGKRALHGAVISFKPTRAQSYFFVRMVELLIQYNANPYLPDNKGCTPLDLSDKLYPSLNDASIKSPKELILEKFNDKNKKEVVRQQNEQSFSTQEEIKPNESVLPSRRLTF